MTWTLLVASLFATTGSGAVLGAALGLTGLILLYFQGGGVTQIAVPAVWNLFTDFTLSAVPMFIFLGEILMKSGVSDRLYTAVAPLFYRLPGRLLHSNIWVCAIFGSVSGSSSATAAAIGSVAYPELARRGYARGEVIGSLAGAGTLGLLIPPSLSLLIYGALQDVSVGALFMAGILPGAMMAVLFSLYVLFRALRNPEISPDAGPAPSLHEIITGLAGIWPLPILIFSVLGTIYFGLATATEAAGLGVAVAIVLGFTWGGLSFGSLWAAFVSSTRIYAMLGMVIVGTVILAQAVANLGLPRQIVEFVVGAQVSKYVVLLLVILIYFVLGCFFDGVSMMIMTLPLVFPLMTGLGFDPVWLGVLITMLIEIGTITPPVGVNLFVLVAITEQEVTLPEASIATVPYWLLLLFGIALLTAFPEIALYLPRFLN